MLETYSIPIFLCLITIINGLVLFILNTINTKVSDICKENAKQHDELFTARREIEKDIERIDELHRIKGCGSPMRQEVYSK